MREEDYKTPNFFFTLKSPLHGLYLPVFECQFGIELGPHEIQYQSLLVEVAFMKEKHTMYALIHKLEAYLVDVLS